MIDIRVGDCRDVLRTIADTSVHCCVTSPPYFGLRDYGNAAQIGLEASPQAFVDELVGVFREVRRVLRDDGTLWLNLGDSYAGSWGNQGRKAERGTQRPINGEMMQPVLDGRYPTTGSGTGSLARTPGLKNKDLIGIPWRVAFALQTDGWYLRQDIIWHKPNPMPESVRDRCTKAHEYLFLLSKNERYYFDSEAIKEPIASSQVGRVRADSVGGASHKERGQHSPGGIYGNKPSRDDPRTQARTRQVDPGDPGWVDHQQAGGRISALEHGRDAPAIERGETRNRRSVWTVNTAPYSGAHFATFPPALVEPCILAGCPAGGLVLDPFGGAGTTAMVADRLGRNALLIEINPAYAKISRGRIADAARKQMQEIM